MIVELKLCAANSEQILRDSNARVSRRGLDTQMQLNLNSEVEVWDIAPNNVGQAFQPAGSPDFPVRPSGD
jgi:hypothetical protein